jgi:hypothetical protein
VLQKNNFTYENTTLNINHYSFSDQKQQLENVLDNKYLMI